MARHAAWWNNACIDRPLVRLTCKREKPAGELLPLPDLCDDPLGRQIDAGYRIAQAENQMRQVRFYGDAIYHLDGPGEVIHLDRLLEIPQIKAIQWVPIAGSERPTSGHWLPLLKRIQAAGKALQVYAKADEIELYAEHLKPEGLMLHFGFTEWDLTEDDCASIMKRIERSW